MSWQSWASNEDNQVATHPSPYTNVSKEKHGNNGRFGFGDGDTWQPYTNAVRKNHVKLVRQYTSSLPATVSKNAKHEKILQYLAENGLRQLGPPRIGIFAERGQSPYTVKSMPGNNFCMSSTLNLFRGECLMFLLTF